MATMGSDKRALKKFTKDRAPFGSDPLVYLNTLWDSRSFLKAAAPLSGGFTDANMERLYGDYLNARGEFARPSDASEAGAKRGAYLGIRDAALKARREAREGLGAAAQSGPIRRALARAKARDGQSMSSGDEGSRRVLGGGI